MQNCWIVCFCAGVGVGDSNKISSVRDDLNWNREMKGTQLDKLEAVYI